MLNVSWNHRGPPWAVMIPKRGRARGEQQAAFLQIGFTPFKSKIEYNLSAMKTFEDLGLQNKPK